jgi:hypothetical protein
LALCPTKKTTLLREEGRETSRLQTLGRDTTVYHNTTQLL